MTAAVEDRKAESDTHTQRFQKRLHVVIYNRFLHFYLQSGKWCWIEASAMRSLVCLGRRSSLSLSFFRQVASHLTLEYFWMQRVYIWLSDLEVPGSCRTSPPCVTVCTRRLCWCAAFVFHQMWPNISTSIVSVQRFRCNFANLRWAVPFREKNLSPDSSSERAKLVIQSFSNYTVVNFDI